MTLRLTGEEPIETLRSQTQLLAPLTGFGDDYLRIGGLKVVLDGGILIGTAYLRTPYGTNTQVYGYSDPDFRGVLRLPREKLFAWVKFGAGLGWQMSAHTTGGASTDLLLEAFEAVDREESIRDRRFTLIHSNFHNEQSIRKSRELNVLVDVQPAWYHFDGPALAEVLGPGKNEDVPAAAIPVQRRACCGGWRRPHDQVRFPHRHQSLSPLLRHVDDDHTGNRHR